MKAHASAPVTIETVRYGERWFPLLFRLPDGLLYLSIEYGHDAHFSPNFQLRSFDGGTTWCMPSDHVPRLAWCCPLSDGELFEIDTYGVEDPNDRGTAAYFGAWSRPVAINSTPRRGLVRVHCPGAQPMPLNTLPGYPTRPWWAQWNELHGTDQLTGDEIMLSGPNFTDGIALDDGRLLAVGYWRHREHAKDCTFILESSDRGATWNEIGMINRPGPHTPASPGTNEATLLRLRDGRLYVVARQQGIGPLLHGWSDDEGRSWTDLEPITLIDEPGHTPAHVWPMATTLASGALALVYGRPGKHLVIDPTGTGTQWQARVDLHDNELRRQADAGVPADQRLRGVVNAIDIDHVDRHTDSGDYLGVVETQPGTLLVVYDVQHYVEHWNAPPISGVRMVRVTVVP